MIFTWNMAQPSPEALRNNLAGSEGMTTVCMTSLLLLFKWNFSNKSMFVDANDTVIDSDLVNDWMAYCDMACKATTVSCMRNIKVKIQLHRDRLLAKIGGFFRGPVIPKIT